VCSRNQILHIYIYQKALLALAHIVADYLHDQYFTYECGFMFHILTDLVQTYISLLFLFNRYSYYLKKKTKKEG